MRHRRLDHEERRSDVDREQLGPVAFAHLGKRVKAQDPGDIAQYVEPPECIDRSLNRPGAVRRRAKVCAMRNARSPALDDAPFRFSQAFGVDVNRAQIGAFRRKTHARRSPQPGSRAGHEDCLAGEFSCGHGQIPMLGRPAPGDGDDLHYRCNAQPIVARGETAPFDR